MRGVLELAKAHPRNPVAGEALRFIASTERLLGSEPKIDSPSSLAPALELLCRDHARDPGMRKVCSSLSSYTYIESVERLMRVVFDQSPNRNEQGLACYALATLVGRQSHDIRWLRERPEGDMSYKDLEDEWGKDVMMSFLKKDPDSLEAEACALLERVSSSFGTVSSPFDGDRRTLGDIASGELFARRNLAIGKVAPEVEGRDHVGKVFKLSDYRGKVVLLSFSGNWCGPCRSMYPEERDLVQRLKDKPFALLSVNTDEDLESLRTSVESGEISWRCWWDGGKGPITTRWGIMNFPTLFLLDRDGVIRAKPVPRLQALGQAVEALLEPAK
ncbi:peroxiredoxin family protein [Singulisphaera sp. GP187]|uniref:peroxiredoxin family protein n=1 Tax=Singulisphaera sp. GP187 TaxID=1882752 RepID=UPI0009F94B3B|nr:TlpA disulfide reductase family protein [Singulisphaera sp. GP187]